MNVADLMYQTLWVVFKISTPLLLVALVVGVIMSFLQALFQVQEQTLTFVPKLFAVLLCCGLFSHYIFQLLMRFTEQTFQQMTVL